VNETLTHRSEVTVSATYPAPRRIGGAVRPRLVTPPDYSLWAIDAELDDGASLHWEGVHGEDAVYVLDGVLEVGGRRCPAGGVIIVEADVAAEARSIGASRIVHFGSRADVAVPGGSSGAPPIEGRGTPVFGPRGEFESGDPAGVHAVWFSDGTSPTCRLQLLTVIAPAGHAGRSRVHSHSRDEIIYVIDGSLHMDEFHLDTFSAACVPADRQYTLQSGPDGHRFLNFRADVSEVTYEGGPPVRETALSRGGRTVADRR